MSSLQNLLTILSIGVLTFLLRFCFIALSDRLSLPDWVRQGLVYVPPAVLSAIVFQEIFVQRAESGVAINLSWQNPLLLSGVLATVAAWWTENVLITMVVGLVALWIMRFGLQM